MGGTISRKILPRKRARVTVRVTIPKKPPVLTGRAALQCLQQWMTRVYGRGGCDLATEARRAIEQGLLHGWSLEETWLSTRAEYRKAFAGNLGNQRYADPLLDARLQDMQAIEAVLTRKTERYSEEFRRAGIVEMRRLYADGPLLVGVIAPIPGVPGAPRRGRPVGVFRIGDKIQTWGLPRA